MPSAVLEQQHRADLPSLGFGLTLAIDGLPPHFRALLDERWPRGLPGAAAAAAAPSPIAAHLSLSAAPGPVGLPPSELVAVELTWLGPTRAELRTNGAELSLDLAAQGLHAEGRIDAERPRGAVEAAVRAVTTVALARRGVLLLHASAVAHTAADQPDQADAVVLLGASGAGKTTTARRLGREGLRRLSDDLIAVDLAASPPVLHRLPFERAGRAQAAPAGEVAACRGGAVVHKGASAARITPHPDPVRAWTEALIVLPPAPGDAGRLLDAIERLCRLPLAVFEAPPSGPLRPAALAWIASLRGAPPFPLDSPAPAPQARPGSMTAERDAEHGQGRRIERAPNVAWRVLDGAAVLVAPSSPSIQTLNEVGTLIWQLADGRPVAEIVDAVVNEFEVERIQASADVESFVRDLEGRGWLVSRPPPAGR